MRKFALMALPLFAISCKGSRWDGIYQVILTFNSWSCTDDTQLFDEGYHASEGARIYVRHTAADSMVISIGNLTMAGPHDGNEFEVQTNSGFTDSSCTTYEYDSSTTFKGSFTKDLGIEGTITLVESQNRQGCQGASDYSLSCEVSYTVEGILIENLDERHFGTGNWGYTPGGGY